VAKKKFRAKILIVPIESIGDDSLYSSVPHHINKFSHCDSAPADLCSSHNDAVASLGRWSVLMEAASCPV